MYRDFSYLISWLKEVNQRLLYLSLPLDELDKYAT